MAKVGGWIINQRSDPGAGQPRNQGPTAGGADTGVRTTTTASAVDSGFPRETVPLGEVVTYDRYTMAVHQAQVVSTVDTLSEGVGVYEEGVNVIARVSVEIVGDDAYPPFGQMIWLEYRDEQMPRYAVGTEFRADGRIYETYGGSVERETHGRDAPPGTLIEGWVLFPTITGAFVRSDALVGIMTPDGGPEETGRKPTKQILWDLGRDSQPTETSPGSGGGGSELTTTHPPSDISASGPEEAMRIYLEALDSGDFQTANAVAHPEVDARISQFDQRPIDIQIHEIDRRSIDEIVATDPDFGEEWRSTVEERLPETVAELGADEFALVYVSATIDGSRQEVYMLVVRDGERWLVVGE